MSWWVRVVVSLAQVLYLIKLYRGTVSCRPLYYYGYFAGSLCLGDLG